MSDLFPGAADQRRVRGGIASPPRGWPFGTLVMGHYGLILCDPPWRFENYSAKGEGKSPQAHYECMDIAALKALPVGALAARDAAIVMWGIWSMLPEAIALMAAWGFDYKSGGAWAKQSSTGASPAFGPGYWYRGASEYWLLGTVGAPPVMSHSVRNLITAPIREHSRKPDAMHDDCERLFAGPRCELFARAPRAGWDVWGNQSDRFAPAA